MSIEVTELQDTVREGVPVRIAGRGTWLDAGRPVHGSRVVDVSGMRGIVEYVPGDLTLTARAGTTLAEIGDATGAEGQWLALDPWGGDQGTLGATVATASAGPLAHAFGTPRDIVLGLEAVTGTGAVVRGGGRVVKNVAGFDLTRLFTGAWGTLGILTEITVRLRARPEVDTTVALSVGATWGSIRPLLDRLRRSAIDPIALEVVNASLARRLGVATPGSVVLVRLAGSAASVRAQRAVVGDTVAVPGDVWAALRAVEPAGAVTFRCSTVPTRVGAIWDAVAETEALVHATPGRGVVRCIGAEVERVRGLGTVIGERLPDAAWPVGANQRLARAVREAFDPNGLLNPGILG